MRRILLILLCLWCGPLYAQIQPTGSAFTPGHTYRVMTPTGSAAGDAGGAAGSNLPGQDYLTEIGITNTGTPFCINDALTNAPYHQLCMGANALGGGLINYQAFGGATPDTFQVCVNGTCQTFPISGSGMGNVVGPSTSVVNDLACWNNTTGTLLKDCGTIPVAGNVSGPGSAVVGDITCWNNTAGTLLKDCLISTLAVSDSPPFPGGNLGSNVGLFPSGSVAVVNALPTSYGDAASSLCVFGGTDPGGTPVFSNPSHTANSCGIAGSLATDASSAAWYPSQDMVTLGVMSGGTDPWLKNVAGSFSPTRFTPGSALSSAQLANLRYGQVLDTNDSPICSGKVVGWDQSGGTYITVAGWYRTGFGPGTTPTCTPAGSTATIRATKVFGMNVNTVRHSSYQQNESVGVEFDVNNSSGSNDTCVAYDIGCPSPMQSDGGVDVAATGANTSSFGVQVRGPGVYNAEMVMTAVGGTYGSLIAPVGGAVLYGFAAHPGLSGGHVNIGFSAGSPGLDEAWRNWNVDTGAVAGRLFVSGNANWGNESVATGNFQQYFSSGHSTPDAVWGYSAGSGANDGTVALTAGNLTLGIASTVSINGTPGVSCSGAPTSGFTSVKGWITHC